MIAVFASTAFIPTGAELAVGAGTTIAAQKVLEAIFGDQADPNARRAGPGGTAERVETLLESEAARYFDRTSAAGLEADAGRRACGAAADDVENAREELALTAAATPALPPGGAS